jgi:hypothetical protein
MYTDTEILIVGQPRKKNLTFDSTGFAHAETAGRRRSVYVGRPRKTGMGAAPDTLPQPAPKTFYTIMYGELTKNFCGCSIVV